MQAFWVLANLSNFVLWPLCEGFGLRCLCFSVVAFRTGNSSAPPVSRTGASFDAGSCRGCHAGGAPSPTIILLANGDTVNGQLPYPPGGAALNMELVVMHSTAQVGGYELTVATLPPSNDAAPASMLSAQTGSTILTGTGGRRYLGHSGAQSFASGEVRWRFTWTPPATDVGTLRWYIAAHAANGDGSTSGDAVSTIALDMPAATISFLDQVQAKAPIQYDPLQKQIRLGSVAQQAEIFTIDGRMVRRIYGGGPHDVSDPWGAYLIRVFSKKGESSALRLYLF